MILGIGIDTISVNRIESLILKFGEKFQEKIFTENEINKSKLKNTPLQQTLFYAKRFAAKEAFSKALGLGIGRGVDFKDIEVENDNYGKPSIKILNQKDQFIKKYFNVNSFNIHISLSDSKDSAIAMVTISSDK